MKQKCMMILKIVSVAAAYFLAGKGASFLAIPPGFASPVWPAAGIALAATLRWGYSAGIGVFLGSFLTNLSISVGNGAALHALSPYLIAVGIGLGAYLQSILGAHLLKHIIPPKTNLNTPKEILSLILKGGVLASLTGAIIGPLVLLIAQRIPIEIFSFTSFTWWIGDVIGVIIITPMLLILLNKKITKLRKSIIIIPTLFFITVSIGLFIKTGDIQVEKRQSALDIMGTEIAGKFEKEVQTYLNILTANERFINASNYVSSDEFEIFTRKFLEDHPGIQSLSWNPKITQENRASHEEEIRLQGYPEYVIKDRISIGKVSPAPQRRVYYPVAYAVPYQGNSAAHGFDTYGPDRVTNIRQKTLNMARDLGMPIATGRISIVQAESQYGLLIYNPVYSNEINNTQIEERRAHIIGYTAGVFILPKMLEQTKEMAQKVGLEFALKDLDSASNTQLLYDSRTKNHQESPEPIDVPKYALQTRINLEVAGKNWELAFNQKEELMLQNQEWGLWALLIIMLVMAGCFEVVLLLISSKAEIIQKDLEETEKTIKKELKPLNLTHIVKCAGAINILLGLVVILGWYIQSKALVQIHPSFAPMQYNTALGFLISGIGLLALAYNRKKLSLICGISAALMGLATLSQYVFGIELRIDQLLMTHYVTTKTSHPGRMAPNTALCFSLIGLLLVGEYVLSKIKSRLLVLRVLGSLVFILGTVVFICYVAGLDPSAGTIAHLTRMAIHTATGFIVLGIGVLAYSWHEKTLDWKTTSPTWISTIVAIIIFLTSISVVQKFQSQEGNVKTIFLTEELTLLEKGVSERMQSLIISQKRMVERWESQKRTPEKNWREDAKNYIDGFPALKVMEWVDTRNRIRWAEPIEGNEKVIGLNIGYDEDRKKILEHASKKGSITLTAPLKLLQGYKALIAYIPIHYDNHYDGFIVGIYEIEAFIKERFSSEFKTLFNIIITDGEKTVFEHFSDTKHKEKWGVEKTMALYNRTWKITLWPKDSFIEFHNSYLPEAAFIVGMIVSLLMGFAIYVAVLSNQRSKLLKQKELEQEGLIAKLTDSNEELERFAYVCSHDLQEPLRMVRSFTERFESHFEQIIKGDEKGEKYMGFILDGAKRAQELIADILEYSSLDRSAQKPEVINLNALIKSIHETMQVNLKDCNGKITTDDMPQITGNKTQIYQLLQNLINNGLKYQSPDAKPHVHLSVKEKGKRWVFSVKDNGIGIDKKNLEKIFNVFQRLHRKEEYSGTGIGLAICKKIIERHGGKIWVESTKGKGTSFFFSLDKSNHIKEK